MPRQILFYWPRSILTHGFLVYRFLVRAFSRASAAKSFQGPVFSESLSNPASGDARQDLRRGESRS